MFDTVKKTSEDEHDIIRALNAQFCAKLPQGAARTGAYRASEGDELGKLELDVPNGTYRLIGGEWLYLVQSKHLLRAMIATAANKFGGGKVVLVPPKEPPPPTQEHTHGEKTATRR